MADVVISGPFIGGAIQPLASPPHKGIKCFAVRALRTLLQLRVDVLGHLRDGMPDLPHHPQYVEPVGE